MRVSEYFYSIQGEGPTTGYPAVFLRLQNCNLFCGKPKRYDLKTPCEGCKWVCDSIPVWLEGKDYTNKQLLNEFDEHGIIEQLKKGAHLVITGGEPLLQQHAIVDFIDDLNDILIQDVYVEIETNGTITPIRKIEKLVKQFNVSPKLSNSGNAKELRYRDHTLRWHTSNPKSIFKFVSLDEEDLAEIMKDFVSKFFISKEKIWMMPGAYTREELWKNAQKVAELCKKEQFRFSSRLQVEIWDKLTGV